MSLASASMDKAALPEYAAVLRCVYYAVSRDIYTYTMYTMLIWSSMQEQLTNSVLRSPLHVCFWCELLHMVT